MKINFLIGTKAQFIKTIPVVNEAIKNKMETSLIDLKQHPKTTKRLRKKINNKCKFIDYSKNNKDLGTYSNLIIWFTFGIVKSIFIKNKHIKNTFCIVHGDTLSTLLGAIITKRNRGKLVLLEAGHRVPGMFKHFPESFVRYSVAKISDFLIANGEDQISQLNEWKIKGKIIEISRNTIFDSLSLINIEKKNKEKKVTITIHRTENLNSKKIMNELVNTILKIHHDLKITWYLHIPTKNKLKSYGLINKLKSAGILLNDLIPYEEFINEIYNSDFVITDGVGVVEECHILGIPTLVWRDEHFDSNHLFNDGKNLYLSEYSLEKSTNFFNNYEDYREDKNLETINAPSKEVIEKLIQFAN